MQGKIEIQINDKDSFQRLLFADDAYSVLSDLRRHLRTKIKYDALDEGADKSYFTAYEDVYDWLCRELADAKIEDLV